jgi:hypothetical protein
MGTQLRQWAARLLAAAALPIMLTLGLGATANAQSTLASHVTSSTHPSTHHDWEVYGPYYSHRECREAQREHGGYDSYCEGHYRYHHHHEYYVWYLYVRHHHR